MQDTQTIEQDNEQELIERLQNGRQVIVKEIRKIIVGQDDIIEEVLLALFTGGHCLITGVPGLAKTLFIRTLSQILDLNFKRIQFTPDLMPADITGIDVIEEDRTSGKRVMKFIHGPLFSNIILADEINRTPPKTQAALLEAMQEHRVTAGGTTYDLDEPFFVMATQNPIELEGTYPLPEAQLDRFMFNLVMDYLPMDEEVAVVTSTTTNYSADLKTVVSGEDILQFQRIIRNVPIAEEIARYAVRLVSASRPSNPDAPDFIKQWVNWGAGIRASHFIILGSKARALMNNRYNVSIIDIQALARPVLRHRILTNFYAESEKVNSDKIISMLLESIPIPRGVE